MITAQDLLLRGHDWRRHLTPPGMDPLAEQDALQEAQLIDLRLDPPRSVLGLLFDLRSALQLREANTGILVAHAVRELSWSAAEHVPDRVAWTVGGSVPGRTGELFRISLALWPAPGAHLKLEAQSAAFFMGNVSGIGDAPPDYTTADGSAVDAGLARWTSALSLVHAVFDTP